MKITAIVGFIMMPATVFLSSCIKDGGLSDCAGHVRIELEWLGTTPRIPSEEVEIAIVPQNGTEKDTVSNVVGIDVDLMPQQYDVVAWEPAQNVTVSGRAVSVPAGADGMVLEPQPFSAGSATDIVEGGWVYQVIDVPMRRQTRNLTIYIQFAGDRAATVSGVDAVVLGVARERDINNGFPPSEPHNRPYSTSRGNIGYTLDYPLAPGGELTGQWYGGTRRLLGIDGDNNQSLSVTIHHENGPDEIQTFSITDYMTGFQTVDLPEDWVLAFRITLNQRVIAEIIDWKDGGIHPLPAN